MLDDFIHEPRAGIYGYLKCDYRETREPVGVEYTDLGRCDYCNPLMCQEIK